MCLPADSSEGVAGTLGARQFTVSDVFADPKCTRGFYSRCTRAMCCSPRPRRSSGRRFRCAPAHLSLPPSILNRYVVLYIISSDAQSYHYASHSGCELTSPTHLPVSKPCHEVTQTATAIIVNLKLLQARTCTLTPRDAYFEKRTL